MKVIKVHYKIEGPKLKVAKSIVGRAYVGFA